jgi:hypothetical protein
MNVDQAGYSYIDTEEGPYRMQRGGAPSTEEIDARFESQDARNPLVWRAKFDANGDLLSRWEPEHDNWYDALEVSPDYLVEKCQTVRGQVSPDLEELLRSPLRKDIYDIRPERYATARETLGERHYDPNLSAEERAYAEAYDAEVNRNAEKQAYQQCKIKLPDDPVRISNKIKNRCAEYMCRDSHISIGADGVPVQDKRRVVNPEDLQEVMNGPLSDNVKAIYQYCADKGLYCTKPLSEDVSSISKNPFVHVSNAGSGECLFIALAQYLKFVQALSGVYPDYKNNTVPVDHYSRLYPWKPSSHLSYEAGNVWRQRAIDWLESNPDSYITGGAEPGTVREMMALSLLAYLDLGEVSLILSAIDLKIKDLYNTFVRNHPEHAQKLGLLAITKVADIATRINEARRTITDCDELAVADPSTVPAVTALVDFFSGYYIKAMRSPDAYAGHLEVYAASKILNADIHIWAKTTKGDQYRRLVYMSHNSNPDPDGSYRTINLLLTQKMNQYGAMSGAKHFEIIFPWQEGAVINSTITLFSKFVTTYPVLKAPRVGSEDGSDLDPNEVDIFLQTLIDMSIQPKPARTRYFYDLLVERESREVAAEQRQGIEHLNYKDGMYLNQFITGTILMNIDRIDLPIILNGLFRMIVRNVDYATNVSERLANSAALVSGSDKRLRLAIRGLVLDIFDYRVPGKVAEGISVYNQTLSDAIIGLGVPKQEISYSARDNIATLLEFLHTKRDAEFTEQQKDAIETLIQSLVIQFCKLIADMYYYSNFRSFFGPSLFPSPTAIQLLHTLDHMTAYMSFDGPVAISEEAQVLGYVMQGQGQAQGQGQEQVDDKWTGVKVDKSYIMKQYVRFNQKGYHLPVDEIIDTLDTLDMSHTRKNFNIIMESLEYDET